MQIFHWIARLSSIDFPDHCGFHVMGSVRRYPFDFPCQLKNWLRVQGGCPQALLFWATGSTVTCLFPFVVPDLSLWIVGVF